MNKTERFELQQIHKRLINLADAAPTTVVYIKGRSVGSVSARIRVEAHALAALLSADDDEQEPDSE